MPQKKVGNSFEERVLKPVFDGPEAMNGKIFFYDDIKHNPNGARKFYKNSCGTLYIGNSLKLMSRLKKGSIDLIFADPPYNINKAEWDNFDSQKEYIKWSMKWIKSASRLLKENGTLYVMGFSEVLSDIRGPASKFFPGGTRWLIWHYKNKANLGDGWGRSHESIIQFKKSDSSTFNQDSVRIPYSNHTTKYPEHPQAESSQYGNGSKYNQIWVPNPLGAKPRDVFEVPVTSNGMTEKTPHPTQKPEELIRRFILASSNEDDLVFDPFSGSGTTLVCAQQLDRKWIGCDMNEEYNKWAIARLETVTQKRIDEWVESDLKIAARRESIR